MPRYKVIGNREVLDHEPGDLFYADLGPVQQARLIAGGHIALALEEDPTPKRSSEKNEKNDEKNDEHADEA